LNKDIDLFQTIFVNFITTMFEISHIHVCNA